MAEMVCSALVQEGVSRAVSSVLGKREKKASQGHIRERLEMAASELELALERSAKLPITDVSLLQRRKMIKCAYVQAAQLLDKHKQQEHIDQGVKRRRWIVVAKILFTSSFSGLNTEDVRRLEWFADCAGKFVRDVESGCSLRHYTFCSPLVRYLLEGKTLRCSSSMEQGDQQRSFVIWPIFSEERGAEALLVYIYKDGTVVEKSFYMALGIRLSESTDIVWVAVKCLQLLTLPAESAMGELTRLQDNTRVIPRDGSRKEIHIHVHNMYTQSFRPDPACCRANRIGHCTNNSVSSEVSHIFPENVIYFNFRSIISALKYSSGSSSDEAGTSIMRDLCPPLELTVFVRPHYADIGFELCQIIDSRIINPSDNDCVKELFPNDIYLKGDTLPQVAEVFFSRAICHFLDNPESTEYEREWLPSSNHGGATLVLQKPSTKIAGAWLLQYPKPGGDTISEQVQREVLGGRYKEKY